MGVPCRNAYIWWVQITQKIKIYKVRQVQKKVKNGEVYNENLPKMICALKLENPHLSNNVYYNFES